MKRERPSPLATSDCPETTKRRKLSYDEYAAASAVIMLAQDTNAHRSSEIHKEVPCASRRSLFPTQLTSMNDHKAKLLRDYMDLRYSKQNPNLHGGGGDHTSFGNCVCSSFSSQSHLSAERLLRFTLKEIDNSEHPDGKLSCVICCKVADRYYRLQCGHMCCFDCKRCVPHTCPIDKTEFTRQPMALYL